MANKVLVIGNGGREHALAWKLSQSPEVETVFVAPGNGGTAQEPKMQNIPIQPTAITELLQFAQQQGVTLTLVGPEAPLALGIVDHFSAAGLACFGPTKAAAQLESSKTFCKNFLQRHGIPTAHYECFTDITAALAYAKTQSLPLVIKADGLAAGKGVVVAHSQSEVTEAIESMLKDNHFGEAGARIVIEQFLQGTEISFIAMVDGQHILPLATSQDHKARDDGDKGPNTGGMGAYSPAPMVTPTLHDTIMSTIMEPTVNAMAEEGHPFTGFLYAGLMINQQGVPFVLEFNCRFGDPETQPIMMRLQSDLYPALMATFDHTLKNITLEWDHRSALGVVGCAGGYPFQYEKGHAITGIENTQPTGTKIFHSGTQLNHDVLSTNGGRVLCATALGNTIEEAQHKAYHLLRKIHWKDITYRHDIGHRALTWELAHT
ncbi:MAG: phosphoribosylamine--glycine ligase [Gammaproteobacteria bacterium]